MTQWYRVSIVMGSIPSAERALVRTLFGADLEFDSTAEARTMSASEVESWAENLAPAEVRSRLRAGLAAYAAGR